MKEFKGSKDEWKCKDIDDESISDFTSTMITCNDVVLACIGPTGETTLEEDLLNAKLMACAPCLLSALQDLVEKYDSEDGKQWTTSSKKEAIAKARAAIDKALGE